MKAEITFRDATEPVELHSLENGDFFTTTTSNDLYQLANPTFDIPKPKKNRGYLIVRVADGFLYRMAGTTMVLPRKVSISVE